MPRQVKSLARKQVVQVAGGANHTLALTIGRCTVCGVTGSWVAVISSFAFRPVIPISPAISETDPRLPSVNNKDLP